MLVFASLAQKKSGHSLPDRKSDRPGARPLIELRAGHCIPPGGERVRLGSMAVIVVTFCRIYHVAKVF